MLIKELINYLFAEVCVVPLQQLSFDELVEGLVQRPRLDRQVQPREGRLALVAVGAALADLLVEVEAGELPGEHLGHPLLRQVLVHLDCC